MTLGETIQYYRKRSGLSQEALAELVGVSRQSVSKWELDESTPEVGKLKALAGAFHVTVDQLLSGEKPQETAQGSLPPQAAPGQRKENTAEAPGLWGMLGRQAKRYGWLFGVYVALGGLGTALVGGIARFAFDRMFRVSIGGMYGYGWGAATVDGAGNPIDLPAEVAGELFGHSPLGGVTVLSDMGQIFVTIATIILVVGILIAIAGAILAFWLYKKGRDAS